MHEKQRVVSVSYLTASKVLIVATPVTPIVYCFYLGLYQNLPDLFVIKVSGKNHKILIYQLNLRPMNKGTYEPQFLVIYLTRNTE